MFVAIDRVFQGEEGFFRAVLTREIDGPVIWKSEELYRTSYEAYEAGNSQRENYNSKKEVCHV